MCEYKRYWLDAVMWHVDSDVCLLIASKYDREAITPKLLRSVGYDFLQEMRRKTYRENHRSAAVDFALRVVGEILDLIESKDLRFEVTHTGRGHISADIIDDNGLLIAMESKYRLLEPHMLKKFGVGLKEFMNTPEQMRRPGICIMPLVGE